MGEVRALLLATDVDAPGLSEALGEVARVDRVAGVGELAAKLHADVYDVAVCDLRGTGSVVLDYARQLRARGQSTPFLWIAPPGDHSARRRADALGRGEVLDSDEIGHVAERVLALVAAPDPDPAQDPGLAAGERPAPESAAFPEPERPPTVESGRTGVPERPARGRSVEFAPAMLWRTDPQGHFTHFTRRWSIFTGRSSAEESGRGWFAGIHPDDRAGWLEVYESALAEQREFAGDVRQRTAEGGHRWVRHHGIPQFDGDGEFRGYIGSSFDITDLKVAQTSLADELDHTRRRAAELEALVRAAAHDLKTPLRNLDYVLGNATEPDQLEIARDQARRLIAVVDDLVEYADVDRGELRTEATEVHELIQWAAANLQKLVEETGGRIEVEPIPRVSVEPLAIARVFQNLLENSLRYCEGTPGIEISGERRDADVYIRVRDNGIGVARSDQRRIFEVFTRLHGPDVPGTGVGLAICRRIVERHGGSIWVESDPESAIGASFWFTVPAAR